MKTKLILFTLALTAIFTASCTHYKDGSCPTNRVPALFSSTLDGYVETRATDTQWAAGDQIGIFMIANGTFLSNSNIIDGADNKLYTTTAGDGNFSATGANIIFFPEDGSLVDFIAYYPYKPSLTNYMYPVDLTNQNPQSAIDLLYPGTVSGKSKATPNVNFTFEHALTKIVMTISAGSGVQTSDLQGLVVTITGTNTTADCNLSNGQIIDQGTPATITAVTTPNGTSSEAIILPGTGTGRLLVFTLSSGDAFSWPIPDTLDFTSGDQFNYTVTIQRSGIIVTGTITAWGQGNSGGEPITAE